MLEFRHHHLSLTILTVIALNFFWFLIGYYDPSSLGATAFSAINEIFGKDLTPSICFVAGFAACWAFSCETRWARILLLIPQEVLIVVCAFGSAHAAFNLHYADGVARPFGFIAADQALVCIVALAHTLSMFFGIRWYKDR